jgi:hypothetical protein
MRQGETDSVRFRKWRVRLPTVRNAAQPLFISDLERVHPATGCRSQLRQVGAAIDDGEVGDGDWRPLLIGSLEGLMRILDLVQTIGSLATAVGVFLAWMQLRSAQTQAQVQFENGLVQFENGLVEQFRAIIKELPVEALLGEPLGDELHGKMLGVFYRYFDLCNEQAFLHTKGRIREPTWQDWFQGIKSLTGLPAFRRAFTEIQCRAPNSFGDLKSLPGLPMGEEEIPQKQLTTSAAG